jgi:SPP1 gp7 family putative phage head morphogenesis protein
MKKVSASRYPFSLEIKYARILIKLVKETKTVALADIQRFSPDIIKQADITYLRTDAASGAFGWAALLNDLIERIALGVASAILAATSKIAEVSGSVNEAHKKDFRRQAREAYGPNALPGNSSNNLPNRISNNSGGIRGENPLAVNILNNEPTLPALLSAWEQQNLALIKSIPANIVEQLRSEFTRAFVNGTNMRDLSQIVMDRTDVGTSRAKLIARDQIGKLNGQLSAMRQKAAGIDSYVWQTMGDERVRPTHRVRNGKTYKWSDPGIKPGEEIRCRCLASPIFPSLEL